MRWTYARGCVLLLAALAALGVRSLLTHAKKAEIRWTHLSSARGDLAVPHPESKQQTGALVVDLDKDGINDFVISFRQKPPALVWYRRTDHGWNHSVIENEFLTIEAGGAALDIDGDDDLDIVFGADAQNNELWWWENPYPDYDRNVCWKRRRIKSGGANQHHDQVFGDFKGTGKPQLVFWNQRAKALFLADIPRDPRNTEPWPYTEIFSGSAGEGVQEAAWYPEGTAVFDVDGDDKVDLLAGNYWFKHQGGHQFRSIRVGTIGGRIGAGRFKKGRVAQIVIAPGDGDGPLSFYECRGDPADPASWIGRDLLGRNMIHGHTLDIGDIDGDGHLDIFTAEMAKWTDEPKDADHPRAAAWILSGDGKGNFGKTELVVGHGWHEGRLADLDGDGDIDILNKPYTWMAPRVDVWLNNGSGRASRPSSHSRLRNALRLGGKLSLKAEALCPLDHNYGRDPDRGCARAHWQNPRLIWGREASMKKCKSSCQSREMRLAARKSYRSEVALGAVLMIVLSAYGCSGKGPPYSPQEALQTIQIQKGFRVDLFANEPMISSPVAMEFDENGRVFVVEMPGYPLDTSPSGKVVLLEDTNGDGRPDRRTVFADGLVLPTGIMRWKKGILVTAAPNVWYLEDTDADSRADVRRAVLTGFPFTNPQHTVNGPLYGLDNWIYLANEGPARAIVFKDKFGDWGGDIRFPDRPDVPALKVHDRSVRFRPDTYELEALSGASQFGHAFDDWGHYFTVGNENQGRHQVIAARYLQRNPDLLVTSAEQDMSDHENAAKVLPITRRPEYQLLSGIGTLTSACSLTVYQGGSFPPIFDRVSFVAEPAQNLVHCDLLVDAESSFVATRFQQGAEFVASTDAWFRPVNFYIGPDGALYLVDYYRRLIEHPEWTSDQYHHESKELYLGSDKGRIYRIVPHSNVPLELAKKMRLERASDQELVHHLSSPNIWWRRTAQRLLVERQSAPSAVLLIRLFKEGRSALGRLHALWTLEGLGKLASPLIEAALEDGVAGVRENGIRLAEPRLSTTPSLVEKLLSMAGDPDAKVRFQLLCTLGLVDSPRSRTVREKILLDNIDDLWMQTAALSASSDDALRFFELAVVRKPGLVERESPGRQAFIRQVCSVLGARQNAKEIQTVLLLISRRSRTGGGWWQAAGLEGLASGASGKGENNTVLRGSQELLLNLFNQPHASVRRASLQLLRWAGLTGLAAQQALRKAASSAADKTADPEMRADNIDLLALAGPKSLEPLFKRLLDPQEPEAVQRAAVRTLGQIKGAEVGRFLLTKWKTLTAVVRSEAADALVLDSSRSRLVLDAIKSGDIQPWTLNFSQKRALIMNEDPEIRKLAHELLGDKAGEREEVVKRYQAALDREGDPARGQEVFKRVCSKCHKKNGAGVDVGPDLGSVQNRPSSILLEDILMPSKSIAQKFEAYVVETFSGGISEGVIGDQTPATITLRAEEGKETTIARRDIKRMYVADLSAMPADTDKQIDIQQMADLLKFLAGG